jgi:SAM-dependent methyltransferase
VLEIGAGIGTITAHLAPGRELVTALEVDEFYVRRLKNRFRGQAHIEPYQSDVALADWQGLKERRFDTIVLSNVLEHIPDDAGAVQTFGKILPAGGRVILYVPALPALFGSIDEAVGHHRRYTPWSLRHVLEDNGFDVEHLQWMNLVGIPGWYVNGRVMKRRVLPPLQLRVYDRIAPWLAKAEAKVRLPVGLSLLCVASRRG